ncbi:hypothetical protein MASR1M12_05180 [Erysipelotrichia bacterium]
MSTNCCHKCKLNIASAAFDSRMFCVVPLPAREVFICNQNDAVMALPGASQSERRLLCSRDLWVLSFIGQNETFAVEQAPATLDRLVAGGHSELLCHLFENAGYEVRRDLWLRMTSLYPGRLYLFDAIFERGSLAPLEKDRAPEKMYYYQQQMLFGIEGLNHELEDL